MTKNTKKIQIFYYALLREERGLSEETVGTSARTAQELYEELKKKYHFKLSADILKAAVNDEFAKWDTLLKSGDKIIFIPPVAGG